MHKLIGQLGSDKSWKWEQHGSVTPAKFVGEAESDSETEQLVEHGLKQKVAAKQSSRGDRRAPKAWRQKAVVMW